VSNRQGGFGGAETPMSRWTARLVANHLLLGTLFEGAFGSTWIALMAFVLTDEDVGKTIAIWIALFVVFVACFGVSNVWRRMRQD